MYIERTERRDIMTDTNLATKEEVKEIVSVFTNLPRTDRAILLNNAMAFKTLREIEEKKELQEV